MLHKHYADTHVYPSLHELLPKKLWLLHHIFSAVGRRQALPKLLLPRQYVLCMDLCVLLSGRLLSLRDSAFFA
jgi:hypothetical protein